MSKLREKLKKEGFSNVDYLQQIADDFAVKFSEWKDKYTTKVFGYYQFNDDAGNGNRPIYNTTELLQIFKDKYYE